MLDVRHWAIRFVALALLWLVLPGTAEATENIAHILRSGHLAHAAESGDSHSEPGPEHGCNTTFHLCSCHLSLTGLLTAAAEASRAPDERGSFRDGAVGAPLGHRHNIEHPPRS